jgi:tellurite resistance protein
MGLFGNAGSGSKSLSKEDAFCGILLAANASDGHISDEEIQGFFTILMRMSMYQGWTGDQLQDTLDRILGMLKRKGVEATVDACAQALPESLRRAAFANACDLVLADGSIEEEEKEFINYLRKALSLNPEEAQMIAKVMVWKNQG